MHGGLHMVQQVTARLDDVLRTDYCVFVPITASYKAKLWHLQAPKQLMDPGMNRGMLVPVRPLVNRVMMQSHPMCVV